MGKIILFIKAQLDAKMFRLALLKTTGAKFVFDFCVILAPHHEIYQKCLSLLTNF